MLVWIKWRDERNNIIISKDMRDRRDEGLQITFNLLIQTPSKLFFEGQCKWTLEQIFTGTIQSGYHVDAN